MAEQSIREGIDSAMAVLKAISMRDDFYDAVAVSTKKQFDALVKVGFSEDLATRIIAGFLSKSDK